MKLLLSKALIEERLIGSSRDNCINWRGAAIRSGDNVIFKAKHHRKEHVGQIIDIQDLRDIAEDEIEPSKTKGMGPRSRWILLRLRSFVKKKEASRPDPIKYCHLPDSLLEVAETQLVEWIPAEAVLKICFIFHVDAIQKGLISCAGIDNVFCIRFKKWNGKFYPLKETEFKSFFRHPTFPNMEGFSEGIWLTLCTLKQEVNKCMCRGGNWNGRTQSAKLPGVLPSFFSYIKLEMEECSEEGLIEHTIRNSRAKKLMYDNLSTSQV